MLNPAPEKSGDREPETVGGLSGVAIFRMIIHALSSASRRPQRTSAAASSEARREAG